MMDLAHRIEMVGLLTLGCDKLKRRLNSTVITLSRRPRGRDGDERRNGDERSEDPISQAINKVTSATRVRCFSDRLVRSLLIALYRQLIMSDFSKSVTSRSSFCTQPIGISL